MLRIIVVSIFFLFSQNEVLAQEKSELTILSWNVFLRPAILNDNQLDRVDSIANYLAATNADVLVLQEVFHKKAKRRLMNQLRSAYKFSTQPGKRSFWGVPSGVVILSKHKIVKERHVNFKAAKGSDKMACKGGVSAIIDFFGAKIQVIGTHLQAGRGEKRNRIRRRQLKKLKTIEDTSAIASFYVGDFNIANETESYSQMMKFLDLENISPSGDKKKTSNFSDNELYPTTEKARWIDFILLRKNRKVKLKNSRIEEPKRKINGQLSRLSDHNPILSSVIISR
ncbi:MAG: sphingomyelin phosphodiesterase [Fluviicola sp.]|nr:sphingomyelin phosphodiesterase [Fluviicola sp.]